VGSFKLSAIGHQPPGLIAFCECLNLKTHAQISIPKAERERLKTDWRFPNLFTGQKRPFAGYFLPLNGNLFIGFNLTHKFAASKMTTTHFL